MTTDALIEHQHAATCKNCGATTAGNFCHQCGQATHLHVPSAREFLHEFMAHYVAIEGKLWRSLKLLLFKPGLLSREYIEGRRVRYVEPLRLYLSFSIIFFAVMKLSGVEIIGVGSSHADAPAAISAPAGAQPSQIGESSEFLKVKEETVAWLGKRNQAVAARAERFLNLPEAQRKETAKRVFYSYAPYAIFLMMPVFAFYLKLLYLGKGRRYGEHFLFALHSNAFAFLMLSLFIVADGWNFIRFVLLAWLVFYLPTAMRRVYGGGRAVTALRWMVLMFLHLVTLVSFVVSALLSGLLL